MLSFETSLQSIHSPDMSQRSRSGPEDETWTRKIRTGGAIETIRSCFSFVSWELRMRRDWGYENKKIVSGDLDLNAKSLAMPRTEAS